MGLPTSFTGEPKIKVVQNNSNKKKNKKPRKRNKKSNKRAKKGGNKKRIRKGGYNKSHIYRNFPGEEVSMKTIFLFSEQKILIPQYQLAQDFLLKI